MCCNCGTGVIIEGDMEEDPAQPGVWSCCEEYEEYEEYERRD